MSKMRRNETVIADILLFSHLNKLRKQRGGEERWEEERHGDIKALLSFKMHYYMPTSI